MGIPKTRVVKVYLESLPFIMYKAEANRRQVSMSQLFKIAVYEFVYGTKKVLSKSKIPILRIDRSPKGSKISKEKNHFKQVVTELKNFDLTKLRKVPENEKKHIYNIMIKNESD